MALYFKQQFTYLPLDAMGHQTKQLKDLLVPPSIIELDTLGLIHALGDCLKVTPEQLAEARRQRENLLEERKRRGQARYEALGWNIKKSRKKKY